MKYKNIKKAKFIERPNRFIARVDIFGRIETVHVKNTGRCKELLVAGAEVVLETSDNPDRKTAYDLVGVYKENLGWVNIDSQAPNKVMAEWFKNGGYDVIKPEYRYGDSRIDFYLEKKTEKFLVEVKGCTLEIDGVGYFPDAPTQRGVKHLKELIRAKKEGYRAVVAFVIAMEHVTKVLPNGITHPEFEQTFYEAKKAGVEIWELPCVVLKDKISVKLFDTQKHLISVK